MHAVRHLAFIACCALLPFVSAERASAIPAPRTEVLLTLSGQRLTVVRGFDGSSRIGPTGQGTITLLTGAPAIIVSGATLRSGNTQVGEFLAASARLEPTGRVTVALAGAIDLSRTFDNGATWQRQNILEIGPPAPIVVGARAASATFPISSGTASGTFRYTVTTQLKI